MGVLIFMLVFLLFVSCIIAKIYSVANIVIGGVVVLFVFICVLIFIISTLIKSLSAKSNRSFNGVKMTSTAKHTLEPTLPSAKDISEAPPETKTEQPSSESQEQAQKVKVDSETAEFLAYIARIEAYKRGEITWAEAYLRKQEFPEPTTLTEEQSTSLPYRLCTVDSQFGSISDAWGAFSGFDRNIARAKISSGLGTQSILYVDALQYCPPPYPSPLLHEVGLPNNGEYQLYNSQTNLPDGNDITLANMSNDHIVASLKLMAYRAPNNLKARIIPDDKQKHVYYVIMFSGSTAPMTNITLLKISAEMPLNDKKECLYEKIAYDKDTTLPIIWPQLIIKAFVVLVHHNLTRRMYSTKPAGYIGYESQLYIIHNKVQSELIGRDAMHSGLIDYNIVNALDHYIKFQKNMNRSLFYGFINRDKLHGKLKHGVEVLNAHQHLLFLYDNQKLIDVIQINRAYVVLHDNEEKTDTFQVQCVSGEYTLSDEGLYGQVQTITKPLGITTMTIDFARRFMFLYLMDMMGYVME